MNPGVDASRSRNSDPSFTNVYSEARSYSLSLEEVHCRLREAASSLGFPVVSKVSNGSLAFDAQPFGILLHADFQKEAEGVRLLIRAIVLSPVTIVDRWSENIVNQLFSRIGHEPWAREVTSPPSKPKLGVLSLDSARWRLSRHPVGVWLPVAIAWALVGSMIDPDFFGWNASTLGLMGCFSIFLAVVPTLPAALVVGLLYWMRPGEWFLMGGSLIGICIANGLLAMRLSRNSSMAQGASKESSDSDRDFEPWQSWLGMVSYAGRFGWRFYREAWVGGVCGAAALTGIISLEDWVASHWGSTFDQQALLEPMLVLGLLVPLLGLRLALISAQKSSSFSGGFLTRMRMIYPAARAQWRIMWFPLMVLWCVSCASSMAFEKEWFFLGISFFLLRLCVLLCSFWWILRNGFMVFTDFLEKGTYPQLGSRELAARAKVWLGGGLLLVICGFEIMPWDLGYAPSLYNPVSGLHFFLRFGLVSLYIGVLTVMLMMAYKNLLIQLPSLKESIFPRFWDSKGRSSEYSNCAEPNRRRFSWGSALTLILVGALNVFVPTPFADSGEPRASKLTETEFRELFMEVHTELSAIADADGFGYEDHRGLEGKILRMGPKAIPLLRSYIEAVSSDLEILEAGSRFRPNAFSADQIRAKRRARAFAVHTLTQIQSSNPAP